MPGTWVRREKDVMDDIDLINTTPICKARIGRPCAIEAGPNR
jgi:hypothetical protein